MQKTFFFPLMNLLNRYSLGSKKMERVYHNFHRAQYFQGYDMVKSRKPAQLEMFKLRYAMFGSKLVLK